MDDFLHRPAERLTREQVAQFLPISEKPPSDHLAEQVGAFNAEVAKTTSLATETERAVNNAVADVTDTGDANTLLDAIDAKRRHLVGDAQTLARLWRRRLEIVKLMAADFATAEEAATAEAKRLRDEVNGGLADLGFDVEETKWFNFPLIVDRAHPGVRAALATASQHRDRCRALPTALRQTGDAAEQATAFVRVVAERIASGKV